MSRGPYGVGDKLQDTRVDELDLECMRGTSAILTEEKEWSQPVDESSSYIFSSKMPSWTTFQIGDHIPAVYLGRSLSYQFLTKSPMVTHSSVCFQKPRWRWLYQERASNPRTPADRLPTQGVASWPMRLSLKT